VHGPGRHVDNGPTTGTVHTAVAVFHSAAHNVCTDGVDHVRARTLMRLVSSVIWL
jgi:hypothetical protein